MKKFFKETLSQLIPVAIGVYIGILAGNWNQNRIENNNKKEFLTNVILEMKQNQKMLSEASIYHENLRISINSLDSILTKDQLVNPMFAQNGFDMIPGWKGTKIPALENSIYEAGMISNVMSGMDFKTINNISKIYNFQKSYKELTDPILKKLYDVDHETSLMDVIMPLSILSSDIKTVEKKIIGDYDTLILFIEKATENY